MRVMELSTLKSQMQTVRDLTLHLVVVQTLCNGHCVKALANKFIDPLHMTCSWTQEYRSSSDRMVAISCGSFHLQ